MAQVRFSEVVKKAGKPVVVTLWTDLKQNAQFKKAVEQNRVLTVFQEPGQTDFGQPGFHQDPHASYLVFPKRLPIGQADKVIGIKYDLIEPPKTDDPASNVAAKKPRQPAKSPPPPPAPPPEKKFQIHVRRTATVESTLAISACTKAEALKKVAESLKDEPFDLTSAKIKNQITGS